MDGIYPGWRTPADLTYPEPPSTSTLERNDTRRGLLDQAGGRTGGAPEGERSTGDDAASEAKLALVAHQVIIQWSPRATSAEKQDALAEVDAAARTTINAHTSGDTPSTEVVTVGGARDVALATLEAHPAVQSAEPNRLLHHATNQTLDLLKCFNDGFLVDGTQWYMLGRNTEPGNKYGINAASSWKKNIKGDPNVYVGIVDEGIDINHIDLAPNKFVNYWDPINGIDDDHNGYIDDRYGWNFVDDSNIVFSGKEPFDFIDAHGTHVAGEVAAVQNNGIGISGTAPKVKFIPSKFLGPGGTGTVAGAVAALDYLTDLKLRHHLKIVASNNSYEGDDTDSEALQAAIQRGADAGILFVTAAGNGDENGGYDIDQRPNYPASLTCRLPTGGDCKIVATAIDRNGNKPEFANWGKHTVDLGAPGADIFSTYPFDSGIALDGTSQTGPLVAGALALYRSEYPWASPTQARRALVESTKRTNSMEGITRTGGRLDVQEMLHNKPEHEWAHDK